MCSLREVQLGSLCYTHTDPELCSWEAFATHTDPDICSWEAFATHTQTLIYAAGKPLLHRHRPWSMQLGSLCYTHRPWSMQLGSLCYTDTDPDLCSWEAFATKTQTLIYAAGKPLLHTHRPWSMCSLGRRLTRSLWSSKEGTGEDEGSVLVVGPLQ